MNSLEKTALVTLLVLLFGLVYLPFMRIEKPEPKSVWDGVDTRYIQGQLQDSCRCTIINGKMYKVKEIVEKHYIYVTDSKK